MFMIPIKKVIFNDPCTIILWTDGTKTVVKSENEAYDPEKGMAMKATYGEFGDKKLFIFKDPKTDTDKLKKSHKGCCKVVENPDDYKATRGNFACWDEYVSLIPEEDTELKTVFKDGIITKRYDFMDIRRRIYERE